MKKLRSKMVKVKAAGADRELVRRLNPDASVNSIDFLAARRSMARSVLCEKKSTFQALDALTAGVPAQTIRAWTDYRLKNA